MLSLTSWCFLIGAAQALPWDGASPTQPAELFALREQEYPKPTAAVDLRKRQETNDITCAWEDGVGESSIALYCESEAVCATNSLGVFGCCGSSTLDDCWLYTTCVDSTAVSAYSASYGIDEYAISCTLEQNPICVTEYIELAVTVTGWICGPTTSANPQTYYPTNYNASIASTQIPVVYHNAAFDGYTPLTLISPTTSTSPSSSPSSTAPSTTPTTPTTTTTPVPPPTPTTPTPTPVPASSSSTPIGAIVGGVIGGVAVIGILVILFFYLRRRTNNRQQDNTIAANQQQTPYYPPEAGVPPMQQNNYRQYANDGLTPMPASGLSATTPDPASAYPQKSEYMYGVQPMPPPQQQQQPPQQYPQYHNLDPAAGGGYPDKLAPASAASPQMSSPSSFGAGGGGGGQDLRASSGGYSSNAPLYSPTGTTAASEMGAGERGSGVGMPPGPVHELGE